MAMKAKRMLVALAAALCVVTVANPMTAYAEESVLEEAFVSDTEATVVEDTTTEEVTETTTAETAAEETEGIAIEETETEATSTDSSFSVSGNGEVLDDITDDSTKEFFTITTANGNTYFLVIDRSSSTENVYMLSMIDEYDLQDFLDEEEADTTASSTGTVVLEEQTTTTETTDVQEEAEETVATEDEDSSSSAAVLLVLLLAAAGGGGAYFYFKVYKPKHDADAYESEGMEIGDGFETINEDEAGDGESDDEE